MPTMPAARITPLSELLNSPRLKSLRLGSRLGSMRTATTIRRLEPDEAVDSEVLQAAELMGRLVELVGAEAGTSAQLSVAVDLLQQVQRLGEPVAWVGSAAPPPYPPDLAARAIDLAALVVVRVGDDGAMLRCADQLLRSGAFGLVVLDYIRPPLAPLAAQVRLAGLCRQHHCALLCLGPEPAFPMASLRAKVQRVRQRGRFQCTVKIDKDKRRGRGWQYEQAFHGPVGMR